ncbi:MAG TPA: hypothetical protein VNC50_17065, partial [Planctomycetia bacterium]|nr:hypothetical protein [Planctomycetia bacterium]
MMTAELQPTSTPAQVPPGEAPRSLHVVHGVLSLDVGGLERIVLNLVIAARAAGRRASVICIERPGTLALAVEQAGGAVISFD